jgi:hypothetical protein
MKILMIGTLIAALSSSIALADDIADEMVAIDQLQQQTFALEKMVQADEMAKTRQLAEIQAITQAEEMNNAYAPYVNSFPPYENSFPYRGNFPYTNYFPSYANNFYPYPVEHTIVVPAPSANEIYNENDIEHSSYTYTERE